MPDCSLETNLVTVFLRPLLSAYALAHNYSKPRPNDLRGSNGFDTCFSHEVSRKIQIRTDIFLQRGLE